MNISVDEAQPPLYSLRFPDLESQNTNITLSLVAFLIFVFGNALNYVFWLLLSNGKL